MHTQNWVLLCSACLELVAHTDFKIEILLLSPLNIINSYCGAGAKIDTWL